jgi:hypothetical protein
MYSVLQPRISRGIMGCSVLNTRLLAQMLVFPLLRKETYKEDESVTRRESHHLVP